MSTGFWIETSWGESHDDADAEQLDCVIEKIFSRENSDADFWIGDKEALHVLKICQNINLHYFCGENLDELAGAKANSTEHCRHLLSIFLKSEFMLFIIEFEKAGLISHIK